MNQVNLQSEVKHKGFMMTTWENIEVSICVISMIGMTVLTFAQVVGRFVFQRPFAWGEEICRFFIIWLTFGGSAYAFRKGAHIGIESLVDMLPPRGKYIARWVYYIGTIIFFLVLGYYGWEHTLQQYVNNQVTPVTRLPVAIPYSAVPIGSALVILRLIYMMVQEMKTGVKEEA